MYNYIHLYKMATTYTRKHSRKQSKRRSRRRKSMSKRRSRKPKSRSKRRSRRRTSRSKRRSRRRTSRSKTRLLGGVKRPYPSILRKPKRNLKKRDNIIWVDTAIVKRPIARKTIAIPQPPSPPQSNVPRKLSRKLF
jgi:hypothetical protein